jgi:hypothetical protein
MGPCFAQVGAPQTHRCRRLAKQGEVPRSARRGRGGGGTSLGKEGATGAVPGSWTGEKQGRPCAGVPCGMVEVARTGRADEIGVGVVQGQRPADGMRRRQDNARQVKIVAAGRQGQRADEHMQPTDHCRVREHYAGPSPQQSSDFAHLNRAADHSSVVNAKAFMEPVAPLFQEISVTSRSPAKQAKRKGRRAREKEKEEVGKGWGKGSAYFSMKKCRVALGDCSPRAPTDPDAPR